MSAPFSKRIYSWPACRASVADVFGHLDDLRHAARTGLVGGAFAEKIMLAVTGVNGCRYCAYGHSRAALSMGVPESEIRQLLSGELGTFPEQEAVALAFAQHYAESACQPDASAWSRVVEYYGADTARDILAYLRMITFGNLYGNTLDAFLSRLAGKPAPGSSPWNELGVLLGVFILVPLALFRRRAIAPSTRPRQAGTSPTSLEEYK